MSNNKIVNIKSLELEKLSLLDLSINHLESIDDLQAFITPEISEIKLSRNNIKSLCALKSGSLTEIDLSTNKITNVDKFFKES